MLIIVEYLKAKISCFHPWRQKENKLGTCDSDDEKPKDKLCKKVIVWGTMFSFKQWLERKEFRDIDPIKEDRVWFQSI
jgi:hypothetical protein